MSLHIPLGRIERIRLFLQRWGVVIAIVLVVAVVFYTGYTVHSGNGSINCLKNDVNQLITQIHNGDKVTDPPTCP